MNGRWSTALAAGVCWLAGTGLGIRRTIPIHGGGVVVPALSSTSDPFSSGDAHGLGKLFVCCGSCVTCILCSFLLLVYYYSTKELCRNAMLAA